MSEFFGRLSKSKSYIYIVAGAIVVLAVVLFIVYNKRSPDREKDWERPIPKAPVARDTVVVKDRLQEPPMIALEDTELIVKRRRPVVLEVVSFEYGSARLTRESKRVLRRTLSRLMENPDIEVQIVGHTDNVSSMEFNERLSRRRAQAGKAWFVENGMDAKRIMTSGKAFREPIASNETPEGRARNRRIEICIEEDVEDLPIVPAPELAKTVDSMIVETDSLQVLAHELAPPVGKSYDDLLYTLHVVARPPDRIAAFDLRFRPRRLEEVEIVERSNISASKPFPKKSLYLAAGAAALGAGAAYFLLSGKEEAQPAAEIVLPRPPGRP